jgi:hypothetical protein
MTHTVTRYEPTRIYGTRSAYLLRSMCGRQLREQENHGRPCRECERVRKARERKEQN